MENSDERIRAVISYAHGPDDDQVVQLADRLRGNGIDCEIDAYEPAPAEGWARWMIDHMTERVVLVVCSETYYRRFRLREEPGVGLGATFESGLLADRVVELQGRNREVIPIVVRAADARFIPEFLRGVSHYDLSHANGYETLLHALYRRPARVRPPLGPVPELTTSSATARTERKMVVLFSEDCGLSGITFREIERNGQSLRLLLAPQNGVESAFLARLRNTSRHVGVSYEVEAVWARVVSVREIIREERVVELQLRDETPRGSFSNTGSINGITADEIAEMRARRILLDEPLAQPQGAASGWGHQYHMDTLEVFVRGSVGGEHPLIAVSSPIPSLARASTAIDDEFLCAAKLLAALYLRLTGTVEHIETLEIARVSDSELRIDFSGIRERVYANRTPSRIEVHGNLRLDQQR